MGLYMWLLPIATARNLLMGGQKAADIVPYFVLGNGCGGSLLADDLILTAAHCCTKAFTVGSTVSAGLTDRNNTTTVMQRKVLRVEPHASFNEEELLDGHDICIVQTEPFDLSGGLGVIHLPFKPTPQNRRVEYAGFGTMESREEVFSDHLYVGGGNVKTISNNNNLLMIQGFSGICNGDSGGGGVVEKCGLPTVVGVASFADDFCNPNRAQGFTNVYAYRDWILQTWERLSTHSYPPPPLTNSQGTCIPVPPPKTKGKPSTVSMNAGRPSTVSLNAQGRPSTVLMDTDETPSAVSTNEDGVVETEMPIVDTSTETNVDITTETETITVEDENTLVDKLGGFGQGVVSAVSESSGDLSEDDIMHIFASSVVMMIVGCLCFCCIVCCRCYDWAIKKADAREKSTPRDELVLPSYFIQESKTYYTQGEIVPVVPVELPSSSCLPQKGASIDIIQSGGGASLGSDAESDHSIEERDQLPSLYTGPSYQLREDLKTKPDQVPQTTSDDQLLAPSSQEVRAESDQAPSTTCDRRDRRKRKKRNGSSDQKPRKRGDYHYQVSSSSQLTAPSQSSSAELDRLLVPRQYRGSDEKPRKRGGHHYQPSSPPQLTSSSAELSSAELNQPALPTPQYFTQGEQVSDELSLSAYQPSCFTQGENEWSLSACQPEEGGGLYVMQRK